MIKIKHSAALLLTLPFAFSPATAATVDTDTLLISAAGGYRKPLLELIEAMPVEKNLKVEASFGHTKQIEAMARQNPNIGLLIGDRAKIEPAALASSYHLLGFDPLTLIYGKNIKIDAIEDLGTDAVQAFAIPHQTRTIFGAAAIQCLKNKGLDAAIAEKMTENDGVPQVGTYVVLGETDAGFVNMTEAFAQEGKIGGYLAAPKSCYDPIEITMAVMKDHEESVAVTSWLDYLNSDDAQKILSRYGLEAQ